MLLRGSRFPLQHYCDNYGCQSFRWCRSTNKEARVQAAMHFPATIFLTSIFHVFLRPTMGPDVMPQCILANATMNARCVQLLAQT